MSKFAPVEPVELDPPEDHEFTLEELALYDGKFKQKKKKKLGGLECPCKSKSTI